MPIFFFNLTTGGTSARPKTHCQFVLEVVGMRNKMKTNHYFVDFFMEVYFSGKNGFGLGNGFDL